ncbi:MAG: hypothetical protein JSW39_29310 [Desulfobacterales bacterium]|nr:MAG: hypothetical protein JSW39_29310 [Desulfobacterales bacterium]
MGTKIKALILFCPLVSLLFALGCAGKWNRDEVRHRIADAYGAQKFDQIEQLQYTFNAQIGAKQIRRSWVWHPHTNQVVFQGTAAEGGTITYRRSELTTQPSAQMEKVDAWFINDQYWLLFPLHLAWDTNTQVEASCDPHPLPIGQGQARRIAVSYPQTGGYTPGDVYELFVGEDDRLVQWIYRRGGAPEPTRMSTWEDHRQVGPLTLSMDHRGPDENFRVWFTDVAVKLAGQEDWIRAQ